MVKKTKTRNSSYRTIQRAKIAGLGVIGVLVPWLVMAQGYVEPQSGLSAPTAPPSGSPALEFLNGSAITQRKLGALQIGISNSALLPNCTYDDATDTWTNTAGCSSLCLNANPNQWTASPIGQCIKTWQDLRSLSGGPFLRLISAANAGNIDTTADGGDCDDGAPPDGLPDPDCGVVSFQADATKNQWISLISEANPGGVDATGFQALSSSTSHYAAQFGGNVRLENGNYPVELCLNGNCITSWNQAQPGLPADALWLQTTNFLTLQSGGVGLNGPLSVNSLVLGTPSSITDVNATCGDGICSTENGETATLCSLDC